MFGMLGCLWFVVCGLLFVVCCLWVVVYGLLFMVGDVWMLGCWGFETFGRLDV
jgi:hypothetical protein